MVRFSFSSQNGWCCFAVVLVLRVPSLPFFRCYSWMSFSCSLPFILYYNNVLSWWMCRRCCC
uniref:Uncharacterized protein n=1 Tax=Anopheles christyi TaxID=43041 RepID=A0A182KI60_9DIPT